MVRKMDVRALMEGMRICGLAKNDRGVITFFNNMLIRNKDEVDAFHRDGYCYAYVIMPKPWKQISALLAKRYSRRPS